jgi:hypothetical protein
MSRDLGYLVHPNVRRVEVTEDVFALVLRDGTRIPLTAEQAVSAKIEEAGNHGCSIIRVTLNVEIEAQGTPDRYRTAIAEALLGHIHKLRDRDGASGGRIRDLTAQVADLAAQIKKLEGDARAHAVRETCETVRDSLSAGKSSQ